MTGDSRWLAARRRECWSIGISLRESLLQQYMTRHGLRERPFLRDVVDELIEDMQGARLLEAPLPLDRYGQSEIERGRPVITINSRINLLPGVKDVAGTAYVAKWHESTHVDRHLVEHRADEVEAQLMLPIISVERPRLIVCRTAGSRNVGQPAVEFEAENAGLAAAIAVADLQRTIAFRDFIQLARRGGDLGPGAWHLLYGTAAAIGVNITALVRYLEQRGLCRIVPHAGKQRVTADPQLFTDPGWLAWDVLSTKSGV